MEATFFASSILILLFSVIVHEVMHGVVALKFGDHTAKNAGRLTLNPLPHIDPIGTILVPALFLLPTLLGARAGGAILGWAKPVPVNPYNFTDIKKGELYVSAAGIGANFLMAIAWALLFHLTSSFSDILIKQILLFGVHINLVLAYFNLLPIPPLDGSKILSSLLPTNLSIEYRKLEKYGFLILMLIVFTPGIGGIVWTFLSLFVNLSKRLLGL